MPIRLFPRRDVANFINNAKSLLSSNRRVPNCILGLNRRPLSEVDVNRHWIDEQSVVRAKQGAEPTQTIQPYIESIESIESKASKSMSTTGNQSDATWALGLGTDAGQPSGDATAGNVNATVGFLSDHHDERFVPLEPSNLDDTGLNEAEVESLIIKQLLINGERSGRDVARQIRLPFSIVQLIMQRLKNQLLVGYTGNAIADDYIYELTPSGTERASSAMTRCTYCGAAPVGLDEYRTSVIRQTLRNHVPDLDRLKQSYSDMVMSNYTLGQLGQAIGAGRSLFLFGAPGNGKTCIAERAMMAIGDHVWIPRSLSVCGQIIRVFDSNCHQEVMLSDEQMPEHDKRWVLIRRPTVVVGGELDFDHLQLTTNSVTGISEAPLQLKSNCGCLVVDDFGRQRINESDLLNRWIIPMEKGYDILNMPNGSNIQVPFDQLLIFATNLNPKDVGEEAFLRRIPYKIEVFDPSEEQFKSLFLTRARSEGFACSEGVVDYLVERHFRQQNRPLRFCHVKDILQQVRDFCRFHKQPLAIDQTRLDIAAKSFFGVG